MSEHSLNIRGLPLLFLTVCSLFFTACERRAPRIDAITPRIGKMGEVLAIRGDHFGDEQGESYITIAGISPTASSYITWRDDFISVIIPEFGESGLVYVHRGNQKSNAALFSNEAVIPEPITGGETGIGARIISVSPKSGPIGSVITIRGNNFGASREGSSIHFAWGAETSSAAPAEASGPESVEVFENDLGYELWNEREIRVRVPDGAISGNLEVRTPRGNSRPEYFEVTEKPGIKVYRDKRSYAISYSVDIKVQDASSSNILYLWVPRPVNSAAQRNAELLSRKTDPFVDNYRGVSLYKLNDLKANTGASIAVSYRVEVYTVETDIRSQQIRPGSGPSPIETAYTIPTPLIPSDDKRIQRQAAAITGKETNPYLKARLIYQWLLREGNIRVVPLSGGAIEALERKEADPYMASLLFCALARASGVAALPVAGVLVDRSPAAHRHFWAEFWVEGFGWIPLDPALGAGAAPASFNLRSDRETYYFGSLDNQRITFSRDQTQLSRMESRGRLAVRDRDYALQTLWEEAVGGIESYSSLWSDVTINGVYVQ